MFVVLFWASVAAFFSYPSWPGFNPDTHDNDFEYLVWRQTVESFFMGDDAAVRDVAHIYARYDHKNKQWTN